MKFFEREYKKVNSNYLLFVIQILINYTW